MLTDEQVWGMWQFPQDLSWKESVIKLVRAVEAAACADRDARIAELERELEWYRRSNRPLSNYEFDEVGQQ